MCEHRGMQDASLFMILYFFFFQAEDGIRDADVTGVQTCALPIYDLFHLYKNKSYLFSILHFLEYLKLLQKKLNLLMQEAKVERQMCVGILLKQEVFCLLCYTLHLLYAYILHNYLYILENQTNKKQQP